MGKRVATAAVAAPLVLGLFVQPTTALLAAVAFVVALLAGLEIGRLLGFAASPFQSPSFAGAAAAGMTVGALAPTGRGLAEWALQPALGMTAVGVFAAAYGVKTRARGMAFLAAMWAVGPLVALVALHAVGPDRGLRSLAFLALLPVWAGDVAAMLAGRAWGRRKLAPSISPGKTVEGAAAQLLAAVATGLALAGPLGVSLLAGGLAGLAAGALAPVGDLFESWVKRRAGVKDSGTILPGHGGLMDRVDGLLFVAPVVLAIVLRVH